MTTGIIQPFSDSNTCKCSAKLRISKDSAEKSFSEYKIARAQWGGGDEENLVDLMKVGPECPSHACDQYCLAWLGCGHLRSRKVISGIFSLSVVEGSYYTSSVFSIGSNLAAAS